MRALLVGLALAVTACGNPETCTPTPCCDAVDGGMATCPNPSKQYCTCGTLGSTIIGLRFVADCTTSGNDDCSFDTINICDPGATSCLTRRDTYCGVAFQPQPICPAN